MATIFFYRSTHFPKNIAPEGIIVPPEKFQDNQSSLVPIGLRIYNRFLTRPQEMQLIKEVDGVEKVCYTYPIFEYEKPALPTKTK